MKNLTIEQLEIIADGLDLYKSKKLHEYAEREAKLFVQKTEDLDPEKFFDVLKESVARKRAGFEAYAKELDEEITNIKAVVYANIKEKRDAIMQGQIDAAVLNAPEE